MGNLEGAFLAIVIVAILAGILLGGLVFWGLPELWALLKPWLHAITAR